MAGVTLCNVGVALCNAYVSLLDPGPAVPAWPGNAVRGAHDVRSPALCPPRRPRASLVPPRRALPLADHGRDGGVVAQRGDADAADRARHERHDAAVDRRLLCPGVRRVVAHRRRPRRPLRPQGRTADRPRRVRRRIADQRNRDLGRARHRRTRRTGRRGGVRDAGDAVADHGGVPTRGTTKGDRHLGRLRRCRRGARPDRVRRLARGVLVGVGVPRQHPDRRHHCHRHRRVQPEVAGRRGHSA